jgi:hypothetical protein
MTTRMHLILGFALATASLLGEVRAQTNATFVFTSSNTVSPSSPTTTIGIWATWDDPAGSFLFGGADYDLTAGDGLFSNPVNVLQPLNGLGTSPGVIAGNMIFGANNGQLHLVGGTGFFGSLDNPILLATYDWTTADFSPRDVNLVTSNTSNFIVAAIATGATTELFPRAFAPGSGVINVVPAPGAFSWLAIPLVMLGARRRGEVGGGGGEAGGGGGRRGR